MADQKNKLLSTPIGKRLSLETKLTPSGSPNLRKLEYDMRVNKGLGVGREGYDNSWGLRAVDELNNLLDIRDGVIEDLNAEVDELKEEVARLRKYEEAVKGAKLLFKLISLNDLDPEEEGAAKNDNPLQTPTKEQQEQREKM